MSFDNLLHIVEILVLGAPLWWSAIRLASLLKDFPPHRHVGRDILYPKGYAPPAVGHINGSDKSTVAGSNS